LESSERLEVGVGVVGAGETEGAEEMVGKLVGADETEGAEDLVGTIVGRGVMIVEEGVKV
jgi:hypothetical protein